MNQSRPHSNSLWWRLNPLFKLSQMILMKIAIEGSPFKLLLVPVGMPHTSILERPNTSWQLDSKVGDHIEWPRRPLDWWWRPLWVMEETTTCISKEVMSEQGGRFEWPRRPPDSDLSHIRDLSHISDLTFSFRYFIHSPLMLKFSAFYCTQLTVWQFFWSLLQASTMTCTGLVK